MEIFPTEVIENLKTYVYRLIDPRNGETFYVGKGNGNRVFAHASGDIEIHDTSEKLKRIYEIINSGFEVAHVIHRHGLDDKTAFEVEAALIDAYPGLTNIMNGSGSNECGVMHAQEIIEKYKAEIVEYEHKALLINVNRSATESSLYESTRFAWKLNIEKASQAEIILAVRVGIIRGVFVAEKWLPATLENFPNREAIPGRYGFIGHEAPEEIKKIYLGKSVRKEKPQQGAANPIRYSFS